MNTGYLRIVTPSNGNFLQDKVALINGLSSDIGASIGEALLVNGAYVAGTYFSNRAPVDALRDRYGADRIQAFPCNVMDEGYEPAIRQVVDQTYAWKGRLNVLVNALGIIAINPFLYETREQRQRVWRINYEANVVYSQQVVRKMLAQGSGDIVNIGSVTGIRGAGHLIAYSTSKSALLVFTYSLAEELGPKNIKVNCISPGVVETKAIDEHYDAVAKELLIKNIPLSRLCSRVDVSNAVLAILMNGYMTANNIVLHGGKL
jgi:NAD(P)-dependent dehydrogenase (short-subunit alcohol dehydrogenase family)